MHAFLLSLLLVFALSLGGRDQWLVAHWGQALGQSRALLFTGIACACASAAIMAWLGAQIAAMLPPRAGQMLVAFALAAAAIELLLRMESTAPKEPTRSLGAIGIVLLARQIGDGARFAVFALAAWSGLPAVTALGGAIGGGAAIALGWGAGAGTLAQWPLRALRLALGAGLLLAALFIGIDARFGAG